MAITKDGYIEPVLVQVSPIKYIVAKSGLSYIPYVNQNGADGLKYYESKKYGGLKVPKTVAEKIVYDTKITEYKILI